MNAQTATRPETHAFPLLTPLSRQELFVAGTGGYTIFRIPVLAASARGTLLAVCEARRQGGGDWDGTDLLLRRSEDGGRSWSPAVVLNDAHDPTLRCSVRETNAHAPFTGGLVHGNAVLIPGPDALVHLVYTLEYHLFFHRVSTDDGRTWSPAREITSAFDPLRHRYPFKAGATGPGHGLRLRDGTLVLPVWLALGSGGGAHRPSVVTTLIGLKDGSEWQVGDLASVDGDHAADGRRVLNPNESALAELPDGRVVLNMRTESDWNRRLVAFSTDGGRHFDPPRFVDQLFDAVCEASMVRLGSRLLFSAPDPRDGQEVGDVGWGNARTRRRLVLASSADGLSWRHLGAITLGPAGYSHLAVHGTRIWCLFEDRARDPMQGFNTGALSVVEIDGSRF